MLRIPRKRTVSVTAVVLWALLAAFLLDACGGGTTPTAATKPPSGPGTSRPTSPSEGSSKAGPKAGSATRSTAQTRSTAASTTTTTTPPAGLPTPAALAQFPTAPAVPGGGTWVPAGRPVDGRPAVFETTLAPPGGSQAAGIAWMDTRLLAARLYSGSLSPGGGPYPYTAPVEPAQASSLVAAFNGGFKMSTAHGGYYTTGRTVVPLVDGAASLVIYADGSVTVGTWGVTVTMTPAVVSVRQNLVPLVEGGQPTLQASSPDWLSWGATCGASSCTGPGIENQWRSGVGVTADGALVYVTGPSLSPLQLADLLVRAGVEKGMQLDINPYWTVFVTYDPTTPHGQAAPTNGSKLLASTVQGPGTFFESWWARDFITMSARAPAG